MFPTSMGRFHQYEDMNVVGALYDKVENGFIQLVCVDSVDAESWYCKSAPPAARAARHDQYDRYLKDEMVPLVQRQSGRPDMATFGCSFGAYHAANFAGRYPDVISKAVCFSGIYDIHRFLDGYWDDLCYYHCPTAYVANMDAEWVSKLSRTDWIIATGEHDSLIDENRGFAALLSAKSIRNHAEFWWGVFGHDWPFWIENVRRFL
jgi:esterase/lipase superfamily enzyme